MEKLDGQQFRYFVYARKIARNFYFPPSWLFVAYVVIQKKHKNKNFRDSLVTNSLSSGWEDSMKFQVLVLWVRNYWRKNGQSLEY